MTYRIMKFDQTKDIKGNDQIFLEVEITDNLELYLYAEWLLPDDVALILTDVANATTIAAQVAARGVLSKQNIAPISFDIDTFLLGLMTAFTPLMDYANILIFYPMIADFARAGNFIGMNMFLQGLLSNSVMTIEQFNILNGVLLQQNIDLNNL